MRFLAVYTMGKTLKECYEVLGLDSSATEGSFRQKCDRLFTVDFPHVGCDFVNSTQHIFGET